MTWRLSGQKQAFVLPFKVDGQFVVPDNDSVSVTVRGTDGALLGGPVLMVVDQTQAMVVTPAEMNSLEDGKMFDTRYIRLDYTVFGQPNFETLAYRIHNFIPHSVVGDTVRALVGADYEELPDRDIEITGAYFSLLNSYGATLTQALTSSGIGQLAANQAIALQAALAVCPSMQARLLKMEKSDTSQNQRHDIDFQKLEADLRSQLADALTQVTTTTGGVATPLVPTIFAVTKQTDRVTGESS